MPEVAVFGTARAPRSLRDLPAVDLEAVIDCRRVIVVGAAHQLSVVLTRLLKADRLDIEVAHVRRRWRAGWARTRPAGRVPLVRDETGTVVAGAAFWLPVDGQRVLTGEAVVDDAVLFDGSVTGVRIEPTDSMPGLRAAVLSSRMRPARWVAGRAAQLGTTGAVVVRDGHRAPRQVRRSTFYRHTQGWLRVAPR